MVYVYKIKLWKAKTNLHNPTGNTACVSKPATATTDSLKLPSSNWLLLFRPEAQRLKPSKVDVDLLKLCNKKGKNHFHSRWWWIRLYLFHELFSASKGPSGRKVVFWTKNTLPPTWSEKNKMTFLYTCRFFYERMSGCLNLCDPQIPWICLNRK